MIGTANSLQVNSFQDLETVSKLLVQSGFFPDTRSVAQAAVKVLAGRELGFLPFASMTGIHIMSGKPIVGAILLAALIRRSKVYDYKIVSLDYSECTLEFSQNGASLGKVTVTFEEAKRSGFVFARDGKTLKDNWQRHADDMLFARAISKGQKRFCPDLLLGVSVYTEDEIEAPLGPQEFIPHIPTDNSEPLSGLVTDPNAQLPMETSSSASTISEAQITILEDLYKARKLTLEQRDRIFATIQIVDYDQIPTSHFQWVQRMMEKGQITVEQSDRIAKLVEELKLPWEKVAQRLLQKFGEPTLVRLSVEQAAEIETSLKQAKTKATTPMPDPNSPLEVAKQVLAG